MPIALGRVILVMDFLAAMGTRIQCGGTTLTVTLGPSAKDPRLLPSQPVPTASNDDEITATS